MASSNPSLGRANKLRTLIVEDNSLFRQTLIESLRKSFPRIVIEEAVNGAQALQRINALLPDLILMDVVMPKMNGFEACKQLRSQDATKAIPIIMVTTRGEAESVESGFQSGCSDYITKPINGLEVLSKVKSALGE